MGLFGVVIYFVILAFFAFRGLKIAFDCKNRFASYASFGFISMIVLQSLMNIAVVGGALPSTGIPLPFFSSGGSSIIITLCMCGFVVNASRCNSENEYVKSMNESFIKVDSISGVDVYE
jgi:cell division protein FtsW